MNDIRTNIERSILGALLYDNKNFYKIFKILESNDFGLNIHKTIYDFICQQISSNIPVDNISIIHFLPTKNIELEYLNNITQMGSGCEHISHYAHILKEISVRESIKNIAQEIHNKHDSNESTPDILQWIEEKIFKINLHQNTNSNIVMSFQEGTINAIKELQEEMKNPDKHVIKTGFEKLDEICGKFRPGELICIAGRPSVGKTSIALQLSLNMIKHYKTPIMFVSLEMPYDQICFKILSHISGIPLTSFMQGKLSSASIEQCIQIVQSKNMPMYIYDSYHLTINTLKTILLEKVKKHGIKVIIIDYLQLIDSSHTNKQYNKEQEISEISRSLKRLAKEIHISIIALSQMSRDIEKRNEKEPRLSDLRGSGSVEQDFDKVIFIYRPDNKERHKINLFVAKNRNGPIGTVGFLHDPLINTFIETVSEHEL